MEEGTRAASEDVDRVSEQASERFVSYRRGWVVRENERSNDETRRDETRREEKRRDEKRGVCIRADQYMDATRRMDEEPRGK